MNKKNYYLLAKKTVKFLNSKNANDITVSISAFNFIKYHPEYIKKIDRIDYSKISKILIINSLSLIKNLFNVFIKKTKIKKEKVDVLIISHLTNKNQLRDVKDFYFGNLERILIKKKLKVKKLLINHTKSEFFDNKTFSNKVIISKSTPFLS